jgi:hypothetical protein
MTLLATALSIGLFAQLAPYFLPGEHQRSVYQQEIAYTIIAHLNVELQVLDVSEHIVYVNRNSLPIDTIFLDSNDHMIIKQVIYHDDTLQDDGRTGILKVPLTQPLAPGDSCDFMVMYRIDIPVHDGTFGYVPGHYEMTEWYPKVCIHDGSGWHFHSDAQKADRSRAYASYDVTIDVPGDYIIAATGTQIDPAENRFMEEYIATGCKTPAVPRRRARYIAVRTNDFIWVCDPFFSVRRKMINGITILFFYRPYDINTWEHAALFSADAITRFQDWFGMLPYNDLALVQGLCQNRVAYPQIVFVTKSIDPLTHLFESGLAADISKQWFTCAVNTDPDEEMWFSEGFSTYAAIRYMEDKYGENHSMIKSTFIPALSLRYFHRASYYLMHTNYLERPLTTPVTDYDIPFAYTNSMSSKPGLFFFALEKMIGRKAFIDITKAYLRRYALARARSRDLFTMIEDRTGRSMSSLYEQFVTTTAYCDWRIKRVAEGIVVVECRGGLPLSSELVIETDHEILTYTLDAVPSMQTIIVPDSAGEIITVAIDPTGSLLDPDYWNNFYPRKIKIRPITSFELPSFSTYTIYCLPYPWYDAYDGLTANFYWFGDRFADFDFVKGGHQIMGGITYGFKSKRAYVSAGYQTPLLFKEGIRLRIALNGSHSKRGNEASVGLLSALGRPFTSLPQTTIENRLVYNNVSSYNGIDSIDWSLGTNVSLKNDFRYRYAGWDMAIEFSFSHHALGSDWDYIRTTCAVQRTFPLVVPCKARVFAGKIIGDAPEHARLFLSSDLHINWFADLLFSQSGSLSPQEHIYIPGDGSMRGYQTLHVRSDQMYVLNLEFPSTSFIRVFADVGYYDRFAFDAGVSLAISAETISSLPLSGFGISANFPMYTYTDEPWALRWSIGFSM